MPVLLLERLPLPSLEAYAVISVFLLAWSLSYAAEKTLHTEWKDQFVEMRNSEEELPGTLQAIVSQHWLSSRARDILMFSIHEPLCIWTVVNFCYCLLVLFGNWLQKQVFGELRVSELQHIKDKFWNFVFYKFIFIFGIINVQSMEGVVLWGSWFSAIGFLHLHSQLCQDRFEYLSMTPCTPRHRHLRLLILLASILLSSVALFFICFAVGQRAGWITFALVAPECLLLMLRTTHVVARYLLYLQSLHRPTYNQLSHGWSPVSYYIELAVEICCLILDLGHHVHMLLRANMLLSMASLVIFMQLRVLYAQLLARLRRHSNYRRILHLVQASCPLVTFEFDSVSDYEDCKCAICWEKIIIARKLPCGHHFHHGCLLHWLEQDASCPTCRLQLLQSGTDSGGSTTVHSRAREGTSWSTWTWTGWGRLLQQSTPPPSISASENSQLESLAEQVQQMFPDYPLVAVIDDLRRTRSVDLTVENILDGRLLPTLPMFQQEPSPEASSEMAPEFTPQIESTTVKFVENPEERQQLLQSRKRDLLATARLRFIQKQAQTSNTS